MEHHEILYAPGIHELFSLINISIVILLTIVFARKAIAETFKSRSQKIREDLVFTREELKKIQQDIDNAQRSLSGVGKERDALIKKVEEEAGALARRLIDEAKANADRIREDAASAAIAEFAEIRAKLKAELLESLVAKVRDEFANENSRQKLHDKLVDGFLNQSAALSKEVNVGDAR